MTRSPEGSPRAVYRTVLAVAADLAADACSQGLISPKVMSCAGSRALSPEGASWSRPRSPLTPAQMLQASTDSTASMPVLRGSSPLKFQYNRKASEPVFGSRQPELSNSPSWKEMWTSQTTS